MIVNKFIGAFQLGYRSKDSSDLQFLLPRFECRRDDIYFIEGQTDNVPPFSMQFSRVRGQEHIYALACEDGEIILLNSNLSARKSHIKNWNAHKNAIFDVCWLTQSSHLITAAGDKTAVLWDTTTLEKIATFRGHISSVKTISSRPCNESVFITGSRDGNIFLWDTRTSSEKDNKYIGSVTGAHDGTPHARQKKRLRKGAEPVVTSAMKSITSVLFQDENIFLSTGSSDWNIKGWDMRYLQPNGNLHVPLFNINNAIENNKAHGYTSLMLNPDGTSFFANCTDGTISQYGVSQINPPLMSTYHGHLVGTFFVKMSISYDGQFIVSGSSDNKAYIWQVSKPGVPLVTLEGHEAEVTTVAWSPVDLTKLITCGDDEQVFQWNTGYPFAENSSENPVVGSSHIVDPKDVRLPNHRHLHTPLSYTTPSTSKCFQSPIRNNSPGTPFSTGKGSPSVLPPLTQWFTPKSKSADFPKQECTPKSESSAKSDIFTPIKAPQRPVFSELSNGEDRKPALAGISTIRRTINFGSKSEPRPGHNPAKRAKTVRTQKNYSITNFFQVSPRTLV